MASKGKAPADIQRRRGEGKKASKGKTSKGKGPEKEQRQPTSFLTRLGTSSWKVIGAAAVLVTLIALYFQFRPSIEIFTPAPTQDDSTLLFSNPFVVKNNSVLFSVFDVHAMCRVYRIWRGTPDGPELEESNAAADYAPAVGELKAGEQYSVPCASMVSSPMPIQRAEVALVIDYIQHWFYFGHTATHQDYRAIIRNGKAYWTPYVERGS